MSNKIMDVELTTITGLHIGVSKDIAEIGGLDAPVIRNPINGLPYIPGSSIKGKMRCLVEMAKDKFGKEGDGFSGRDGSPCGCGDCLICRNFGSMDSKTGPTRLIVRDAVLHPVDENGAKLYKDRINKGLQPTEIKTETAIDRLQGSVKRGSLRTQERIPPGYKFQFQVVYRDFIARSDDERQEDKELILEALKMLEEDTLGKSGSRGYGQVELKYDKESFLR